MPSPSDGWHACSRRCQLALDQIPRNRLHPNPLHSLGDCNEVCVFNLVLCLRFSVVAFTDIYYFRKWQAIYPCICWQKGDRPDNDLRWAMQHPAKKKKSWPTVLEEGCIVLSDTYSLEAGVPGQFPFKHFCFLFGWCACGPHQICTPFSLLLLGRQL